MHIRGTFIKTVVKQEQSDDSNVIKPPCFSLAVETDYSLFLSGSQLTIVFTMCVDISGAIKLPLSCRLGLSCQ